MKKYLCFSLIIFFLVLFKVNASIEDDLVRLNEDITRLENNKFLSSHPVGSIYITTNSDENTIAKIKSKYGGEWEAFGTDKVLRGTTGTAGQTGGTSGSVALAVTNLPAHNHSYTPSGSVTSSFTGTAVNTGNNSANPTGSFSGTRALTESSGAHTHSLAGNNGYNFTVGAHGGSGISGIQGNVAGWGSYGGAHWFTQSYYAVSAGSHQHYYTPSGKVTLSGTHYHSVTAKGSVSSTFTGTAANTSNTGSGTAFSVLDPYITVYMYRRTK